MKITGQTIVKAYNDVFENDIQRNNEDACLHHDNVVAISDGAGGVGILADKWANTLVNNVPSQPFKKIENIDKWMALFWEDFYNKYSKELQDDPWKIKKFEEEGSLATLSVIWQTASKKFQYESYGDSVLFIFNKRSGKLHIQNNFKSINSFTSHPALLNWATEKHHKQYFFKQTIHLQKNDEIILATDGIAMYIYGAYLTSKNTIGEVILESKMQKIVDYYKENPIKNFKQWILKLKESLNTTQEFYKWINKKYETACLPNDDYTLVFIEE